MAIQIFQTPTLIPALRAAIAFDCDIQRISHFDRKHYFYQDQPSGYQITQYYGTACHLFNQIEGGHTNDIHTQTHMREMGSYG